MVPKSASMWTTTCRSLLYGAERLQQAFQHFLEENAWRMPEDAGNRDPTGVPELEKCCPFQIRRPNKRGKEGGFGAFQRLSKECPTPTKRGRKPHCHVGATWRMEESLGLPWNALLPIVLAALPLPQVVGAIWYLFAIESGLRCWNVACRRNNCYSKYLYCGESRVGDYGFLNTSCPLLERNEVKDSTNFDFGIYLDALQTRVLETRDFSQKILYCSWWGLQSLSSLGQGLKASTYYGEILFADFIVVIGLVLFALLIGNMQKYLQSFSNLTQRVEEMKEKTREAEELMSHISLPEEMRQRVRRHKQYNWKITKGVELDSFVRDLPRDLRRDVKRHLCLFPLMRVPFFKQMDEHLVNAMCDRLKPVIYTENSFLVREGDLVHEILFIARGKVLSETTDDRRIDFYNSIHLKAGDLCGEELLTWSLDPATPGLPLSTRTVKAVTDVQAFALLADDLMFVACQFRHLDNTRLQHTYRFYSQPWRMWAACYIQHAWRTYYKGNHEKLLQPMLPPKPSQPDF